MESSFELQIHILQPSTWLVIYNLPLSRKSTDYSGIISHKLNKVGALVLVCYVILVVVFGLENCGHVFVILKSYISCVLCHPVC